MHISQCGPPRFALLLALCLLLVASAALAATHTPANRATEPVAWQPTDVVTMNMDAVGPEGLSMMVFDALNNVVDEQASASGNDKALAITSSVNGGERGGYEQRWQITEPIGLATVNDQARFAFSCDTGPTEPIALQHNNNQTSDNGSEGRGYTWGSRATEPIGLNK